MAFVDLQPTQMVTQADAATGGFPLNPGQSHGSSNQCMTKLEAITKYSLNTNNLTGYADNQLIPKSVWATGTVVHSFVFGDFDFGSGPGACYLDNIPYDTLYTLDANIVYGTQLFIDEARTTAFDGDDLWWKCLTTNKTHRINHSGFVQDVTSCGIYITALTAQFNTAALACANNTYSLQAHSHVIPVVGTQLYSDSDMTVVFNGGNRWYKDLGTNRVFQIAGLPLTIGVVSAIVPCGAF